MLITGYAGLNGCSGSASLRRRHVSRYLKMVRDQDTGISRGTKLQALGRTLHSSEEGVGVM